MAINKEWREQAITAWVEAEDETLMLQQFIFYMEELTKMLRQPEPDIEAIAAWLEDELETAKQELEW